jgi:hypothetical protein
MDDEATRTELIEELSLDLMRKLSELGCVLPVDSYKELQPILRHYLRRAIDESV